MVVQVSCGLGEAMVGVSDLHTDPVHFRDREGELVEEHLLLPY